MSLLDRLGTLVRGGLRGGGARELNGFVDTLLQKFEDSRPGLPDEAVRTGAAGSAEKAERYFLELYEKEVGRLLETIRVQSPHLSPATTKQFLTEVDEHVRRVVVPAYVRLARRFTARERNDFYLSAEAAHGVERILFALGGMIVGAFVVVVPWIPLNAKEWVVPFLLAGLLFPELRRVFAIRRYVGDLDQLVARADREIARLDVAYLTSRRSRSEVPAVDAEVADGEGTYDIGAEAASGNRGASPDTAHGSHDQEPVRSARATASKDKGGA